MSAWIEETYAEDFSRLLRVGHSPTQRERQSEGKKLRPFWSAGPLLDCRFSIVGPKAKKSVGRFVRHGFFS
jgi:hypothetical protein